MEKKIAEEVSKARQMQMVADYGKAWFIEALTHTGGMVQRGEFPAEAHQVGQMCYQQFMGIPPIEGGEKPKGKDAPSES
ncbi:MAG: hypothetical protein MUP03_08765 [Anaerolineales bacterium]|nr:hypothetical protein [Anaerolineales bacterium]